MAGERDREKLASLCHSGIKCTQAQVARALEGNYRAEHVFALGQALEAHDFFQHQLEAADRALEAQIATVPSRHTEPREDRPQAQTRAKRRKNQPHFDLREQLRRIAGVDLTRVEGIDAMTAFSVFSETGMDMTRFPSEKAFSSWMHLCPNNRITGGRVHSRRVRPGVNRAGQALKVAAQSLHHSKSALGAYFRRMKARLGPQKAIVATAHKLARLIYRLLKYGEAFWSPSPRPSTSSSLVSAPSNSSQGVPNISDSLSFAPPPGRWFLRRDSEWTGPEESAVSAPAGRRIPRRPARRSSCCRTCHSESRPARSAGRPEQ